MRLIKYKSAIQIAAQLPTSIASAGFLSHNPRKVAMRIILEYARLDIDGLSLSELHELIHSAEAEK